MAVIGVQRGGFIDVKVIAVFHQKLAAPHHPKTRAHLVAELPLDVVKGQRQVFIAGDMAAENVSDHFLIRRTVQQFAFLPIGDAQHFLAVVIITTGFAPKIGWLQRRHQQGDVACAFLFFIYDLLNPPQNPQAQRQPRINPRRLLFDHPRPQHVAVRYDLRLGGVFFQDGQEIPGQTHGTPLGNGVARRLGKYDGAGKGGVGIRLGTHAPWLKQCRANKSRGITNPSPL